METVVTSMDGGRRARGFTLLELMVVVAIIAILAAIALPAYSRYVLRSKIRLAQSDLLALSANVENFRQRTLSYPPSAEVARCSRAVRSWLRRRASSDRRRAVTSVTSTATPITAPASSRAGNHCDW